MSLNYVGILFLKVITLFHCNTNNLLIFTNEVKDRIHADDTENSDKVMVCNTKIPSTSNALNNLAVNKSFHSTYIQT